jgi:aspartate/methionine/tyrosine aminotransferase
VFSRRLQWDNPLNPLAALEQDRRATGAPLIDLTESNPTRVGLPYPERPLRDELARVPFAVYQPAPRGLLAAREAVAAEYARAGLAIDAERIVLTASSSESYGFLFKLLADPGDAVLVPEPSYPLFDYLARLEGVRPIGYRLIYDGSWRIDFDTLEAGYASGAAAGAIRAVVVVNPNNPTGSFIEEADLVRLAAFCERRTLAVISDEVFAAYRFGHDDGQADMGADRVDPERPGAGGGAAPCLATCPTLVDRTLVFSLGGLSKSCGLPQLKLGWIVIAGPRDRAQAALARLELIADTYLSVGSPVQLALPRLFELGAGIRRMIQARVGANRARLSAALPSDSPCTLLPAQGGWTAILRVPSLAPAGASDELWASTLLREDGVLIHPGYLYDMPPGAYLIASLLPRPEIFADGVARVVARCGVFVP